MGVLKSMKWPELERYLIGLGFEYLDPNHHKWMRHPEHPTSKTKISKNNRDVPHFVLEKLGKKLKQLNLI